MADRYWDRDRERRGRDDRDWPERQSHDRSWENRTEPDWRTSRHENEGGFDDRTRSYWNRGPSTRSWDRGDRERDYDDRQQHRATEQQHSWHDSGNRGEWNDRDPEGRWAQGSEGGRGARPGYIGGGWDRSESQPDNAYPQNVGRETYGGVGQYGGGLASGAGRYAGRGPKNWKRADDRIREDVNEALTRDPDVDATDIEVEVSNGEVTLTGAVENRHMKHQAEECVWRVTGVREVHNNLRATQGIGGMIANVFRGDEKR